MPIDETKTHDCAAWLAEGTGCAECNVTAGAIRQYWDDPVRKERDQLRAERDALARACHGMQDDIKALLAERNLLLSDKVRLDWLNAQRRQNLPDWGYTNGSYYWHVYSASNNTESMDGARLDLREAIDDVINGRA